MGVRADFSVPAADFVLGDAVVPYLWVSGSDLDAAVAAIRGDPDVTDVTVLDDLDGEVLVRLEWIPGECNLIEEFVESDAVFCGAVGAATSWSLRLRFPDRERLGAFYRRCLDRGIGLSVERVFEPERNGTEALPLTDAQLEMLELAFELGYFDVPREVTFVELADELDISDTAASQRLRRGVSTLVGTFVAEPSGLSPGGRRP